MRVKDFEEFLRSATNLLEANANRARVSLSYSPRLQLAVMRVTDNRQTFAFDFHSEAQLEEMKRALVELLRPLANSREPMQLEEEVGKKKKRKPRN